MEATESSPPRGRNLTPAVLQLGPGSERLLACFVNLGHSSLLDLWQDVALYWVFMGKDLPQSTFCLQHVPEF